MYSNLLSPAGVGLQDAVFTLNVYRAEDLPQSEFDLLRDFFSTLFTVSCTFILSALAFEKTWVGNDLGLIQTFLLFMSK